MPPVRLHPTRIMLLRFSMWSVALTICCTYQAVCSNLTVSTLCRPFHDSDMRAILSPRFLSDILGSTLGPLFLWLPVAVHAYTHAAVTTTPCRFAQLALLAAMCCWLIAAPPARLTRILWGPFDPSGHILLTGVQLIPLWAANDAARSSSSSPTPPLSAALRVALFLEPLLWWMSFGTAAFYHSASDVAVTWLVAAVLVLIIKVFITTSTTAEGDGSLGKFRVTTTKAGSPPEAAEIARLDAIPRRCVQFALLLWTIESTVFLYCVAASVLPGAVVGGGGAAGGFNLRLSIANCVYDGCVALAALCLSLSMSSLNDVRGGKK